MRRIVTACCAFAALLGGCNGQTKNPPVAAQSAPATITPVKYASYGTPMKLSEAQTVPVDQLLADAKQYEGKYVRVSGTVASVCPKKGCWMRLGNDNTEQTLFVKFPDPEQGRLLPMEAVGKPAVAEGTLHVKQISEATARHYKQDANASQEEIEKIVGPQLQISITNGSAQVGGL